ncbi:uncharacterized protein LOC115887224 [Sitophilus oryzae]|uniref:Uncharacterized protein LOC115887224 n=1 Tax=Sitophilus oryzae TaxID=7048 RepID=A0A6J2YH59_SITOR|nr:uncharacterized protein LOC115887224 [Sitophilus oryzae]
MFRFVAALFILGILPYKAVIGSTEFPQEEAVETTTIDYNDKNDSTKDVYVIRKVVYEIGILTETDNNTNFDNKTHEQVDISFFDPADNGTFIDLSKIPIPVEANISGVAVTGIVTSNIGGLVFPSNDSAKPKENSFPIFPDKQVKVTRNISTTDQEQSANILSGISDVLGLSKLVNTKPIQEEDDNANQ